MRRSCIPARHVPERFTCNGNVPPWQISLNRYYYKPGRASWIIQRYSVACSPERGSSLDHLVGPHVDETALAAGLADEVLELGYLVLAVAVEFAQLKAPETRHGCHVVMVELGA